MGKIKEAYMIQQEIIQHIEEKFGKNTVQDFDIIEYCAENKTTPEAVRTAFLSASEADLYRMTRHYRF